jgi:hypothetical protein
MKPKRLFSVVLLIVSTAVIPACTDADHPAIEAADYTVSLGSGDEVALVQPEAQVIYSNIIALLKTSNFNSSERETQKWPGYRVSGVEKDYRWTASGKYLVVSFKRAQRMETIGGVVNVREIVVGLDNGRGRNQLFTIDDNGRVISHGKYSGPLWVKLREAVQIDSQR